MKKRSNRSDKKSIVSGCNHVGKLIGRSSSTGNRRMKMLGERGLVKSINVAHYKDCLIDARAMETMNDYKHSGALILPTNTGYKTIYGKKILAFNLGLFKYGEGRVSPE